MALDLTASRPQIFWKLAKVSFREIITMRTAQPVVKEGAIEHLLCPSAVAPLDAGQDRTSAQGALVRSPDIGGNDNTRNIKHISSTVSNLQDSITELKSAFTSLRIELNGPGLENNSSNENNFGMVSTVLRELKEKTDEIVKLRLEIEALKVTNKYAWMSRYASSPPASEATLPTNQERGLLLPGSNRKRSLVDPYPTGRTQPISDPFDKNEDSEEERLLSDCIPLGDVSQQSTTKVPLRGPEMVSPPEEEKPMDMHHDSPKEQVNGTASQAHTVVKRPRLLQATPPSVPKRGGRPRKSFSQTPNSAVTQTPKPNPLGEASGDANSGGSRRGRARTNEPSGTESIARNLRSRSRPPSSSWQKPQEDSGGGSLSERNQRVQAVGATDSSSLGRGRNAYGSLRGPGDEEPVRDLLSAHIQESIRAQESHRERVSSRDKLALKPNHFPTSCTCTGSL